MIFRWKLDEIQTKFRWYLDNILVKIRWNLVHNLDKDLDKLDIINNF